MPSAEAVREEEALAPPDWDAAGADDLTEALRLAVDGFFQRRGWQPFPFQRRAWEAFRAGRSGLIHVPTGAGKTYAAFLGPLAELAAEAIHAKAVRLAKEKAAAERRKAAGKPLSKRRKSARPPGIGLRILYVTPLRAVARDIETALRLPVDELALPLTVESRTGDTAARQRRGQKRELPEVLITTPESLTGLLTWPDAGERFAGLSAVIVDEWHELLGTKRGTQTELALARLRRFAGGAGADRAPHRDSEPAGGSGSGSGAGTGVATAKPRLRTWALSATLANLGEAARAAVGVAAPGSAAAPTAAPEIVSADLDRPIVVDAVVPETPGRIPWAGHLGLSLLDEVLERLDPERSTLLFTNTRSQCERWHAAIRNARPGWAGRLGIHHGSLSRGERERVEAGLKDGVVTLVVCTSSLDLGVDFPPVERVFQIGSPKGVSRVLQRAGRSAHRPGETCALTCVPAHAFELVEIAAVRQALDAGDVEERSPLPAPLDVLAQHLVTCALGGGFRKADLLAEVRTAYAYRDLTGEEMDWTLALVEEGGGTLAAYPEYHKVVETDGVYTVPDRKIARLHRMNVGTITSDAALEVRYLSGKRLGTVEESFLSRLEPGESFMFAGRVLELAQIRDMTAYVRRAKGRPGSTPRWMGGRLPISPALSEGVRRALGRAGDALGDGAEDGPADPFPGEPELTAALPVLAAQQRLSRLPGPGQVLAELTRTREGHHLFLFPFEGRLVHEGLGALLALRAGRHRLAPATTFSLAASDYGLELLSPEPFPWPEVLTDTTNGGLFTTENLAADAAESVNLSQLAKRQFREIARVSGLVFEGHPGVRKTARQVQASASLLYDVFVRFDPENLLLAQARREVLERHFEASRLAATLRRLAAAELLVVSTRRPTPFAFPLVIERLAARVTAESLLARVERMKRQWANDMKRGRD